VLEAPGVETGAHIAGQRRHRQTACEVRENLGEVRGDVLIERLCDVAPCTGTCTVALKKPPNTTLGMFA
jgi:hypothetical protein